MAPARRPLLPLALLILLLAGWGVFISHALLTRLARLFP